MQRELSPIANLDMMAVQSKETHEQDKRGKP
jgi:hypothetical protein